MRNKNNEDGILRVWLLRKSIWTILVCIHIMLTNLAFAQGDTKVENLIPPSPESSALGKYAQIPIGHYTGVPNISVPLVEISEGDITVPVSLSYHASGNKVDEITSRAGLGWTLNAGGVIMRTVVGEPDESPWGFLNTTYNFSPASIFNGTSQAPKFALWRSLVECRDAEPDIFVFNFNGYVGTFGFEWNSDQNYDIKISTSSKMKVESLDASGNPWYHGYYTTPIGGFKVTTADGMVYIFRDSEHTYHRVINRQYTSSESCRLGQGSDGFPPVPAVLSWHLTKIISPNGHEINFNYTDYSLEYHMIESEVEYHRYGCWDATGYKREKGRLRTQGKYLSNITTSSGHMLAEFNASQNVRTDLPLRNDGTSNTLYSLGEIKLKHKSKDIYKTVKHYRLAFNYETGRLTLKSLEDLATDMGTASAKPPYRFHYNTSVTLPAYNGKLITSYKQDHWGFLNGNTDDSLIPRYDGGCYPDYEVFPGANREPSADSTKAGMLVRIQYPTGGTSEFEYEPHTYGAVGNQNISQFKMAGGVRIRQITDKDAVNPANDIIRQFKYEFSDGKSSGVISNEPRYDYWAFTYQFRNGNPFVNGWNVGLDWDFGSTGPGEPQDFVAVSATSSIPLGRTQGNHIGYRKVTELYGNNGIGGKSEYYFSSFYDHNDNYVKAEDQPFPLPETFDYKRGLLTKRIDYKFENNQYDPVKQIEHEYDSVKVRLLGFKVGEQYPGGRQPGLYMFRTAYYYYILGYTAPVYTRETRFENGSSLVTDRRYIFDQRLQFIQKETSKTSDGKEIITEYTYPFDYSTATNPIVVMNNRHMLSSVIEKVIKIRDVDGAEKVVDASFIQYDVTANNKVLPIQQLKFSGAEPVSNFSPSTELGGLPDFNYYTSIYAYNKYNAKDKPEEITMPGDVVTSYIWNYDGTLPVAKIINGSFSRSAFSNFESFDRGNWNYDQSGVRTTEAKTGAASFIGTITSNNLITGKYLVSMYAKGSGSISVNGMSKMITSNWQRYEWTVTNPGAITVNTNGNVVDDLRLHPVEARMNTFTYEPGVGMTSITDENHKTSYFEYDGFGRLKNVRDNDLNIRKNYHYHYKN